MELFRSSILLLHIHDERSFRWRVIDLILTPIRITIYQKKTCYSQVFKLSKGNTMLDYWIVIICRSMVFGVTAIILRVVTVVDILALRRIIEIVFWQLLTNISS